MDEPAERWPRHTREAQREYGWRRLQLRRMGYGREMSELIARSTADIHDLERMLKDGCAHEVAASIVL